MIRTAASKLAMQRCALVPARQRLAASTSRLYSVAAATTSASSGSPSLPPLGSIEAAWAEMPPQEQEAVFHHLESLQKKDWKELTLEEKKASYFVSFGPHGPRAPLSPPGQLTKVFGGVAASIAAALALFATIRYYSPAPPPSMTKEWQEASMEIAKEQKMDPFTGPASDSPRARTMVQSK